MNVKRFTARTAREALAGVRQAFGEDAVVLSTKPCLEGIEVVAMAPESLAQFERVAAAAPAVHQAAAATPFSAPLSAAAAPRARNEPSVAQDVSQLGMSTMSFQSYVRERMLKRREAALSEEKSEALARRALAQAPAREVRAAPQPAAPAVYAAHIAEPQFAAPIALPQSMVSDPSWFEPLAERLPQAVPARPAAALPSVGLPASARSASPSADQVAAQRNQQAMMAELRQVKGLIEDRFGALAFMDKLQRHPGHARLTQRLLDSGFSAALIR